MSHPQIEIEELRDMEVPPRLYIITTGAGAKLLHSFWSAPGISSVLVGAEMPYASEATEDLLGFMPTKFVSQDTALLLAQKAFSKALLAKREGIPIGLGITASVATLKEHRGEHQIYCAVITPTGSWLSQVKLQKQTGANARELDDRYAEAAALQTLHVALGKKDYYSSIPVVKVDNESMDVFLSGHTFKPASGVTQQLFYPGAFNPIHDGHIAAAFEAERDLGKECIFWITVNPPHKPQLTVAECLIKLEEMKKFQVRFTKDDPLYIDKARKFPSSDFIIGADAMERLLDPEWTPLAPMLEEFHKLGTRFWVGPRIVDGVEKTIDTVKEANPIVQDMHLTHLFVRLETLPNAISSTQIREARAKK